MRKIVSHVINPANDKLIIEAVDEPGSGGAHHRYEISGFDTGSNQAAINRDGYMESFSRLAIIFQNGPIKEAGINGVTIEALVAIAMDRLRSFQAGPYACRENALALTKFEEGLHWLQQRTIDRMRSGVEGTSAK